MRWLTILAVLSFALLPTRGDTSSTLLRMGGSDPCGSASYPGDCVSGATVWVGLSAYTAAIAAAGTQALANIIRASDSHTCDLLVASGGGVGNTANCSSGLDNSQSASSFCNATTCNVAKLYDQTGNGNDVLNSSVRPLFSFNCINSLPCVGPTSSSSNVMVTSGNVTAPSASLTAVVVGGRLLSPSGNATLMTYPQTAGNVIGFDGGANLSRLAATGTINGTANDGAIHTLIGMVTSGTNASVLSSDGTEVVGTLTLATGTTKFAILSQVTSRQLEFMAGGVWSSTSMNSTQRAAIYTMLKTRWGTP